MAISVSKRASLLSQSYSFLVGSRYLGIKKLYLLLEVFGFLHEFGVSLLVLLALLAEEHVCLYKFVSLLFELRFTLQHFSSDLFLVGCIFELIKLLLLLDQFFFVLIQQSLLFHFKVSHQLIVQILNHVI